MGKAIPVNYHDGGRRQEMRIIEQLKTICEMEEFGFDLENTQLFNTSKIRDSCKRCKDLGIKDYMKQSLIQEIQQELISNPRFAYFYRKLCSENVSNRKIGDWLYIAGKYGDELTDYPVETLISVAKLELQSPFAEYDYLKYFSSGLRCEQEQLLVAGNIRYFYHQDELKIEQLTDSERDILKTSYFQSLSFDGTTLKNVIDLISNNKALQQILELLSEHDVCYALNYADLKHLQYLQSEDVRKIEKVMYAFGIEGTAKFMERWRENKGSKYDLDNVSKHCDRYTPEEKEELLDTQIGYINSLYSGRLNVPYEEIGEEQRDVLIYAIGQNANHFLNLVSENFEAFSDLDERALVFDREFYTRCNLNSLTLENLKESHGEWGRKSYLYLLDEKEFTFQELKCLRYVPADYVKLFNRLEISRVDDRLLVIRQLLKRKLLPNNITEEQIDSLSKTLSIKPLSVWREKDFSHITGLKPEEALRILMVYDEIKQFIPEIRSREEAGFAARNAGKIQGYTDWEEIKHCIADVDTDWGYLIKEMGFSEEFIAQNNTHILQFLVQGGAEMTRTYYDYIDNKEAFRRVVQAELMGQFQRLKYFEDDIQREIDIPIERYQQKCWQSNRSATHGPFYIAEADDFYTTLLMGTLPYRTCLSYDGGAQRECLLSGYDSNKKILLARRKNGEVVARAIIRLTKGTFQMSPLNEQTPNLEFADLMAEKSDSPNVKKRKEYLTVFLERSYFASVNEKEIEAIKNAFISLIEEKAKNMDASPVLALAYCTQEALKRYVRAGYYLYISKSKGGAQYLDSLSGEAFPSQEGSYERNQFLILQSNLK